MAARSPAVARRQDQACRIGVSDALRLRRAMLVGDAREDQADVLRAPGLYRRVEEELVEHILLRVAAAEAMHVVEHRPPPGDRAGMLTPPMRQHRLADGERDFADDRG